jgi:hypothetical protein
MEYGNTYLSIGRHWWGVAQTPLKSTDNGQIKKFNANGTHKHVIIFYVLIISGPEITALNLRGSC